ncbi:MAG: hypothetical protein HC905_28625 [Bacteroidales bacterium]|nr:hypothetical protein [Bacteroidales bacterium]
MNTKLAIAVILFLGSFFIQSCQKEEIVSPSENIILPERFKVDIPSSISSSASLKSGSVMAGTSADTLKGNAIYLNLITFVAVGEGAADIVQHIIGGIAMYHINKPMTFTFESDDDHRVKNLVVKENATYNGKSWKYMMTISDAASVSNPDSGKALQIFWNPSPIEGVAILKPYNIDRSKNTNMPDALFRIEYSEIADQNYDSHMIVDMAGLPLSDLNMYAIKNLRMFVGKKGDIVDVYGNSDHPNARFFTQDKGFNWAFVASGSASKNISTAEVGLPPCDLSESSRKVLLQDYSIKNVLTEQVNEWFLQFFGVRPHPEDLNAYLKNADAPGFFNKNGFVQAGTAPNADYASFVTRIGSLTPYSPKSVSSILINFK